VERVAEVVVARGGGDRGRRGSGYLVAPGRVLTAAHVVDGASGIRVRFEADRPGERIVTADVVWRHRGIDVAVLGIPEAGPDDGATVETDGERPCRRTGQLGGMSGAAVFSGGYLMGVVTRHHLSEGPGRIAAGRVDRWAEALTPDELASLERAVRGALRPQVLPDCPAASSIR
jgi:S1-C subfamily serine protease